MVYIKELRFLFLYLIINKTIKYKKQAYVVCKIDGLAIKTACDN